MTRPRRTTPPISFKACRRCGGDMQTLKDVYGEYRNCLQCGHIVEIEKQEFKEARVNHG